MEKILFVTDAQHLTNRSLDFAGFLCQLSRSKLTGVFLEEAPVLVHHDGSINTQQPANGLKFIQACEAKGIAGNIQRDAGLSIEEIVGESRYADLLLINANTTPQHKGTPVPARFVQEVLYDAECPVIVMPERFDGLDQIIFTFDGNASSIHAIKQFTYLFPELKDLPVNVISIVDDETHPDIAERYKLKEWLHAHYRDVQFTQTVGGNTKAGLVEHLLNKERAFIVMGAFGRSALSTFFNPSHGVRVLKVISQAVFIAHC